MRELFAKIFGSKNHLRTGAAAEEQAELLFKEKGYEILARDYRVSGGELDIVARKNGMLVFAEVKARRSDAFGGALFAVTKAKQRKLTMAALGYIKAAKPEFSSARFDAVLFTAGRPAEHIENAFPPAAGFDF